MSPTRLSGDEIVERGQALYEQQIRQKVEIPENIGKICVIDVESGDYEVDSDGLAAGARLRARHPDPQPYGERIGYEATYAIGGAMRRREP